MKAKIYYQDLSDNLDCFKNENLIIKEDGSILVGEVGIDDVYEWDNRESIAGAISKSEIAEAAWKKMNNLCVPVGHPDRSMFRKAGHTSMSVGDYIEFEDGEKWIAAMCGWEIRK